MKKKFAQKFWLACFSISVRKMLPIKTRNTDQYRIL